LIDISNQDHILACGFLYIFLISRFELPKYMTPTEVEALIFTLVNSMTLAAVS
jgi:hypothetical protein